MAKSLSYFLKKYNQIPDLTPIDILKGFEIIKCEQLTAETYVDESYIQEISSQLSNCPELNSASLLNDAEASPDQQLIKLMKQAKDHIKLNINESFIEKSDTSLDRRLAKSIDFTDVIKKVNESASHYILVTQSSKSYKIFIDKKNIPHILGLPSIETVTSRLNSKLTNYLISKSLEITYDNYLETIQKMLDIPELKADWFNSLFIDISADPTIGNKDNTDKIAYKLACFRTLINSISIGDSDHFGNANSLMTYESEDKSKIMSIINIPNTDGYLGLICLFNEKNNYYILSSIVAFNEKDIKDTIRITRTNYKKLNNVINTNSNVTFVKNEHMGTQREENIPSKIIYNFSDDNISDYNKKYYKFDDSPYTIKKLKFVERQTKKASLSKNTVLRERILDIINNVTNKDELSKLLPKYLIYIILTCNPEHEDFIYNILTILENGKYDNNILEILKKFYSMDKKTFYDLISNEDDNNESEIGFTVSENQISINCCFKYSISNNNKVIPFSFTSNDIEEVKNQFEDFISYIYNEILYNDQVVLNVNNIGTDNDKEFIHFSRTIKNLIELQKFGIAFIEEIKSKQKRKK